MDRASTLIVVALGIVVAAAPATAAEPRAGAATAPVKRVTVKEYRPQGLLPSDLETFLNANREKLTPQEQAGFKAEWENFKTAWEAWQATQEKPFRKAMDELSAADATTVTAARAEMTRIMNVYPSSFTVFRAAAAKLSPANAVRFARLCADFTAARDVWLKSTQDITAAIGATAYPKSMADAAASAARQDGIAVRQSLKYMRAWKESITRNDDPNLLTISRTMDYYERVDGRNVMRLIEQAPTLFGKELHDKFQYEVMTRMTRAVEIVGE